MLRWCRHADVHDDASTRGSSIVPAGLAAAFDTEIGLVYTELGPAGARARLTVHDRLLQPMGLVHGGVYCAMIESMASSAAFAWLSEHGGGNVVGVNNNTDFLRSARTGTLHGSATPLHRGRRQQLWAVSIVDDPDRPDRLIARGQVRLQNLPADPA
ncbi:PaaI family thioesterase [Mycolicibacillus parakoreensis]|nr:PaaI family thioesterase [Mycolicibacillus parakoreensis]